ncbi:hypothetical protein [Lysinibacillus sp. NPDC092081]|uniref:hypothetical protein n=1 Tax=Lysinibacillus sp. NPDC092081 TaxID=3364131 RepID=UPI0037F78D0F
MLVMKALSQDVTHLAFVPLAEEASATNVFCAKAKRQQQMFSVRKRSVSNKCFLCESEASATKRVARSGNQPLRLYKNG